jgi:hypothetical protein
MKQDDARAFAIMRATRLLGEPYIWGGDDVDEGGFDCSGLVHEVMNLTARHWDGLEIGRVSARNVYAHYTAHGLPQITDPVDLKPGCLVFFARPRGRIFHVKMHIASGPFGRLAIDAGGAGSNAVDLEQALRSAASVRMSSSIHHAGAQWVAVDPFELIKEGGDLDLPLGN